MGLLYSPPTRSGRTGGADRPVGGPVLMLLMASVLALSCTDTSSDDDATAAPVEADPVDNGASDPVDGADDDGVDSGLSMIATAVGPILDDDGEALEGPDLEVHLARRFEAFWLAFDIARQAPSADPERDYPELAALAAGEQLEAAYDELRELHRTGHAIRNPETAAVPGLDADSTHRIRLDRLEIGVAELESCQVNDQVRYALVDDEVLSDSVLTARSRSTMAVADGSWKIIRSQATELAPGVAGCWLEDQGQFPY